MCHDNFSTDNLLYSSDDVGRNKAQVAFQRLGLWFNSNAEDSTCYPVQVEDIPLAELSKYDIIIGAVDSLETRRWINCALCAMKNGEGTSTPIYVDGGSQYLYGHVNIVIPGRTACIECCLPMYPQIDDVPPCRIRAKPKTTEDCIRYVTYFLWPKKHDNELPDGRRADVVNWIHRESVKLGKLYGINGITVDMVDRVLNRSVPNIPSTNSIIASLITNELNRIYKNESGHNFIFYTGDGVTSLSVHLLKPNKDCPVCSCITLSIEVNVTDAFSVLVDRLKSMLKTEKLTIMSDMGLLYMSTGSADSDIYEKRLEKSIRELKKRLGPVISVSAHGYKIIHTCHLTYIDANVKTPNNA